MKKFDYDNYMSKHHNYIGKTDSDKIWKFFQNDVLYPTDNVLDIPLEAHPLNERRIGQQRVCRPQSAVLFDDGETPIFLKKNMWYVDMRMKERRE